MKNSRMIIFLILLFLIMLIIWFGQMFSPGSYANTPKYEFNISEEKLIENIRKLKEIDTTLNVPNDYKLIEGRKDMNDKWYHFYIYYSKEKEILNCWVRSKTPSSSTLALVSIMNENQYWNVLEKNEDLEELEQLKLKFEERVINKLNKLNNE